MADRETPGPRIEIRRLQEDDFARFREIRLRSLDESPDAFASTAAETRERTDADWRSQLRTMPTFVAVDATRDVGVVRVARDEDDDRTCWLISLWVDPAFRGLGVGEKLVRVIGDWAREARLARVLLDVADENAAACGLYARTGYRETGETGSLPPPREHIREHRMALELDDAGGSG